MKSFSSFKNRNVKDSSKKLNKHSKSHLKNDLRYKTLTPEEEYLRTNACHLTHKLELYL